MTSTHRVWLGHEPGELLAALPHLLGFHPTNSLIVLSLHDGPTHATLGPVLRTDLAPPDQHTALADQLTHVLARQHTQRVLLALIGPLTTAGDLPAGDLITTVSQAFAQATISVAHTVWAAATRRGQPWRCYDDPDCAGLVADPDTSPLAVAAVVAGRHTYASRAALAGELDPDNAAALARRAHLLAGPTPRLDAGGVRRAVLVVRGAIERTADGHPPNH
jgi:hypothetical protein